MDQIFTDLRYAARQLVRAPGFAAVAILMLALGIGVNSALFTVTDSIIRKPRPGVGESTALVWVAATTRDRSRPTGVSYQVAERLRREIPLFERVVTIREFPLSLATRGDPVKVKGQAVSGDYFAMLRAPIAIGRGLVPDDDTAANAGPVAVLNHHTWTVQFAGDSSIIGSPVIVNGLPLTVVGVTAPGFNGAEHDAEVRALWVSATLLADLLPEWRAMTVDPASTQVRVMARLRSSRDRAQVAAAVGAVSGAIAADDSLRPPGWTLRLYDASAGLPAGGAQAIAPIAALSLAVSGMLLLICCANVSNLMLARALARQREIATRLSIGASRGRIVRQLLTESILIAGLASGAGLLLAVWGTEVILRVVLPIPLDLAVDWRVVVLSAALALGTGLLFGLAPALHATRGGVAGVLREAGTGGDRRRARLQGGLVMAQVALSLLLLTMSGLFLRSLDKAQRVDVGFDASARVLALSFDVGLQRYDSARSRTFVEQVLSQARAMPGVERVSLTDLLPLSEWSTRQVRSQRDAGGAVTAEVPVSVSLVRPEYFVTLGVPLVAGRDFTDGDVSGASAVAIVSEQFARQHLGGTSGLGARVQLGAAGSEWREVVGVVRDAVVQSLHAPMTGAVYLPERQLHASRMTVLVRSHEGDAGSLVPALREVVRALDPALPIHRQVTLDRVRADATREQRAGAALLAGVGGVALLLAAIGLHGVMLFSVRQRTREIGIRMALGATGRSVVSMFVRHGLRLTIAGGGVGVVLALASTRLLRSMLFGVTPTDAVTFGAVSLLFVLVAVLSTWMPARRAARIDPVSAMRVE